MVAKCKIKIFVALMTFGLLLLAATIVAAFETAKALGPDAPAQQSTPQFRPGMRVMHSHFGEGMVIESQSTLNDEVVTVDFDRDGIKKLSAAYAKLHVLDQDVVANDLSNCKDAYLKTSTGNYWLSNTLAKPENEQLRMLIMSSDGLSWSEGMETLANSLCNITENHGVITVHFISTFLMPAYQNAADCADVDPNAIVSLENPLQIAVCNFLMPLFHDHQDFLTALELDPSITVPDSSGLPDPSQLFLAGN